MKALIIVLLILVGCSANNVIEGPSPYVCQPSGAGIMATCQEK